MCQHMRDPTCEAVLEATASRNKIRHGIHHLDIDRELSSFTHDAVLHTQPSPDRDQRINCIDNRWLK